MEEIVTPLDVLQIKGPRSWYYKGRKLSDAEIKNLKSEATTISNLKIWQLLIAEGKYHAQRKAILDTKTKDDVTDMETLRSAQAEFEVTTLFEKFIATVLKE